MGADEQRVKIRDAISCLYNHTDDQNMIEQISLSLEAVIAAYDERLSQAGAGGGVVDLPFARRCLENLAADRSWRRNGCCDPDGVNFTGQKTAADALAALAPSPSAGEIEHDPHDNSREYIPLPGGWEVQTKGAGSSYRLLDKKTGERHSILSGKDWQGLQAFFTRFAHELFEACRTPPATPVQPTASVEAATDNPEINAVMLGERHGRS